MKLNKPQNCIIKNINNVNKDVFNNMADEYDNLTDLWYPHLLSIGHKIILENFGCTAAADSTKVVLDVGCGTGEQSGIFLKLGYNVVRIDVSEKLLSIAQTKYPKIKFIQASAEEIPFPDNTFDIVNCFDTLHLIQNWELAIKEMCRVLKPGGKIFLCVEHKFSLEILWEFVSAILNNCFQYDENLKEVIAHFRNPKAGHWVDWPYIKNDGTKVYMKVYLFTKKEIKNTLEKNGIRIKKLYGIHFLTNLLPSTFLQLPRPSRLLRTVFSAISRLEKIISKFIDFSNFSSYICIIGEKKIRQLDEMEPLSLLFLIKLVN